ncbi:MAG: terpene cyclase/mutase family protein [Lentisphaerae bacterium]|nr:terpene cyclase/mutase family protein [Lentisphaerota bacterium]
MRNGFVTRLLAALLALPAGALCAARGAETGMTSSLQPAGTIPLSLANEVDAAINRSLEWLAARQNEDGSWSDANFPAITALALQAFLRVEHPRRQEAVDKAVKYILSCVQEDGGIYREVPGRKGGGLSNYNTAICMTALHAAGRPELTRVVQKARAFLAGTQHFGDDEYRGGFGYDKSTGRAYTDLLNTYYAVTAMRSTQDVEDKRPAGEKRVDIDWSETVKFIERMQNKPESGDEAGGLFYNPADPKAGTATNASGAVFFRSYGSITYAGMLAMIYANLTRDDVRVRSAFDWAARHWSLDENPGMGQEGLYFFYNVLTRALTVHGADIIPAPEGSPVNWKPDLAARLVRLQKIDADGRGCWVNEVSRYWEGDPVLVTSYATVALELLR